MINSVKLKVVEYQTSISKHDNRETVLQIKKKINKSKSRFILRCLWWLVDIYHMQDHAITKTT